LYAASLGAEDSRRGGGCQCAVVALGLRYLKQFLYYFTRFESLSINRSADRKRFGEHYQRSGWDQLWFHLFCELSCRNQDHSDGYAHGRLDVYGLEWRLHRNRGMRHDPQRKSVPDGQFRGHQRTFAGCHSRRYRNWNRDQFSCRNQLRHHVQRYVYQRYTSDVDGGRRIGIGVSRLERSMHWNRCMHLYAELESDGHGHIRLGLRHQLDGYPNGNWHGNRDQQPFRH